MSLLTNSTFLQIASSPNKCIWTEWWRQWWVKLYWRVIVAEVPYQGTLPRPQQPWRLKKTFLSILENLPPLLPRRCPLHPSWNSPLKPLLKPPLLPPIDDVDVSNHLKSDFSKFVFYIIGGKRKESGSTYDCILCVSQLITNSTGWAKKWFIHTGNPFMPQELY